MRLIVCGGMLPIGWTCEVMKYVHLEGSIFYDILVLQSRKIKRCGFDKEKKREV